MIWLASQFILRQHRVVVASRRLPGSRSLPLLLQRMNCNVPMKSPPSYSYPQRVAPHDPVARIPPQPSVFPRLSKPQQCVSVLPYLFHFGNRRSSQRRPSKKGLRRERRKAVKMRISFSSICCTYRDRDGSNMRTYTRACMSSEFLDGFVLCSARGGAEGSRRDCMLVKALRGSCQPLWYYFCV